MNTTILTSIILSVAVVGVIGSVALSLNDEITYIPKNILGLKTDNIVTSADATTTCDQSLTTVKNKALFPVLTPTVMLEGYTLQGAEYIEPSRVQLKYSDGNVCGEHAKTLRDGVIDIIAGPLDTAFDVKDGKELANLFANNSPAKDSITSFASNGKQIIGIPAWVGKSVVIDDNNKIINEEPYDTPTTVFVVDDSSGMLYRLNGFIPMEDLLQIAKSLK
jgi:hypothetical protein